MFLTIAIFMLVLLLSFAVVMLVTRPTTDERTIGSRIARLSGPAPGAPSSQDGKLEIIKQTAAERRALAR